MRHDRRVVFIGAGNMAEALVGALVRKGVSTAAQLCVTDPREERLAFFRAAFGVDGTSDNLDAVRNAGVIILAVKPQSMNEVLTSIQPALREDHVLISIAAGVTTARMEAALPSGTHVVRTMPNTPALVGMGVTAICPGAAATDEDLAETERLLGASGLVLRVEESEMDAVTAVSGSGPAYVFYLMEAMQEAARRMGLKDDTALALIQATIEGSGRLVHETGLQPLELRERVTSKGGTTAAALSVMQEAGVFDTVVRAMEAARARAAELSKE